MSLQRLQLPDFSGRLLSLADGPEAWELLCQHGDEVLLLGLGPGTGPFLSSLQDQKLYWLEAPEILTATQSQQRIPSTWVALSQERARSAFTKAKVYYFRQNAYFAPAFWSSFLGHCFAQNWQQKAATAVYIPGNRGLLLHRELVWACRKLGFDKVVEKLDCENEEALFSAFSGRAPAFCLSVNGRGLDVHGRLFALFKALHVPCAIWLVDNPWHVLSRFKLPWWKEANLFVTDPTFIPTLSSEGAKHVSFLPLACAPHMWRPLAEVHEGVQQEKLRFVGSSAFPGKDRFFAATRLPDDLLAKAGELAANGGQPDIHWWYRQSSCRLWPGAESRLAGAGTELCSQARRVRWLEEASRIGCEVVGDKGWKTLLPKACTKGPVDYYRELPDLYSGAIIFNITSLQLPGSLNQRHFDVWAAGGFLITDAMPGLEIFPKELWREIAITNPSQLRALLSRIGQERRHFYELQVAWRECLSSEHSYLNRLHSLFSELT